MPPDAPDTPDPNDTPDGAEAPKIIIDSDWKSQAQAEKEKLAEEESKAQEASPAGRAMPEPSFASLVDMLAMQAVMYLGGVADPKTGQAIFDPIYARHMIELLAVLEEKTKGNLTEQEAADLAGVLRELRARFVEIARLVEAQQAAQGGAGGGPAPGAGVPGAGVPGGEGGTAGGAIPPGGPPAGA